VSPDEYLFEGPTKNQTCTFGVSADGFHNILLPFCGENQNEIFC
jgi:hypothetical protein